LRGGVLGRYKRVDLVGAKPSVDFTLGDHALGDHALSDHALSDRILSDCTPSGRTLSAVEGSFGSAQGEDKTNSEPRSQMTRGRVAVAMSGGVDSSVAAALLVEQGYDVIGITMHLWSENSQAARSPNRSYLQSETEDARRVSHSLGIPFYVLDYAAPFRERVVEYFLAEYTRGRTPNPCLACNRYIKFGLLLEQALTLEADYLATGHYARVRSVEGEYQLWRGVDRGKDQSYFLYMLGQEQLRQVLLPLGDYTKEQVRGMARERNLPVRDKAESQDLCFIADKDYHRFLSQRVPEAVVPGPIVDTSGNVLGEHHGLPFYTIGQRKGLGISSPAPLYVLHLDVGRNALVVGTSKELGRRSLVAGNVTFVSGRYPVAASQAALRVSAKIRYRSRMRRATVTPLPDGQVEVVFDRPLRDITPGQAVVFYRGEVLLGGGIIAE